MMQGQQVAQPHNGEKTLHGEFPPAECHFPCVVSVSSPAELCESRDTRPHRVVGGGLHPFLKR